MIRQELVEEEGWISRERFNRVLSVYQILPGPEAHELCVYFGMLAGGRLGGFLAGLGFMLPGFIFMFALSWFYSRFGLTSPVFAAVFAGFQPAVVALIVRAVHRIGEHAISNRWLLGIALLSGLAQYLKINFFVTLLFAGFTYVLIGRRWPVPALALTVLFFLGTIAYAFSGGNTLVEAAPVISSSGPPSQGPAPPALFIYGLRSGLLTFGGAYTVIPFLQHDAVEAGRWMTNAQFLDGIALSGILPAPLIIFSTFVGYLGGGPIGALLLTAGIFLPAFAFTMVGHDVLERLVENRALHSFLDGVTAGVVGLISATALDLIRVALTHPLAWLIFGLALLTLYRWKAKIAVAVVVIGAGVLGLLLLY